MNGIQASRTQDNLVGHHNEWRPQHSQPVLFSCKSRVILQQEYHVYRHTVTLDNGIEGKYHKVVHVRQSQDINCNVRGGSGGRGEHNPLTEGGECLDNARRAL